MLHGRDGEAGAVAALLEGAREGRSGALVLRGDAGIGKTALLRQALAAADAAGMTVVRGSGVEFEAELPYAGLELLLRKAMGALGLLPGPQQRALRAAFGLAADGGAEPMFVGLAVLSLLSGHAGEGPLLCVVDDAHWLDRASCDALAFAARRLDAEGVAMLFAARDTEGSFAAPGLPELRLGGLDEAAAAALLAERGGTLGEGVRRQVLTEAQGNPLALLELPLALGASAGRGQSAAATGPGTLPLTSRLQMAFHGRASHLPRRTQTLLLVAAADHTGDPELLLRATTALDAGVDDLPPAEEAGLVLVDEDDKLRFRHPLIRAAIYQRAPLGERLAAHRALAEAADPVLDPDHRAWHLAAAATGPDAAVATALEATAARARERSGHAAAAAAYERAARLSTDPAARVGRLLLAAESAAESAAFTPAGGLAAEAVRLATRTAAPGDQGPADDEPADHGPDGSRPEADRPGADRPHGDGVPDPVVRARALYVDALGEFWQGAYPSAHRMLLDGAELAARAEPARAGRMLVQATHTAWYSGPEAVEETVRRLAALELPPDAPIRPVARFLTRALGPGADTDAPPSVAEAAAEARARGADPRDLVMVCGVGLALGQDARAYDLTTALAAESRESGAVGRLTTILFFHAEAEIFAGRLDDAHASAAEGLRIARDTRQGQWVSQLSAALAYIAAVRGDEDACRARTRDALAAAAGSGPAPGAPWTYWSQGVLELGLGRARSALDRFTALTDPAVAHQICAVRSVPDLVEAAVRLGEPERADAASTRFERWARRSREDWARALAARCRALRASDADAEAHFTEALDAHDPHLRPLESARTALLYGEWLRRARRTGEARERLRTALDTFERLGARPWADRARGELGAAGVPVTTGQQPRSAAEEAGLTPQETQIVRLAARGLSNKDIAAQLFLSPRTVGYHLYKAYPKLGVVSRGELAAMFG